MAEEDQDAAEFVTASLSETGPVAEPFPWVQWAWRAWHRLKDDRQWRSGGMGPAMPCGIPYGAVASYADRHGHDADTLYHLIEAMDGVYAEWWGEQAEAANKGD